MSDEMLQQVSECVPSLRHLTLCNITVGRIVIVRMGPGVMWAQMRLRLSIRL